MIFHYQDHTFRIGFRYDKSRRWLDHKTRMRPNGEVIEHWLVFRRESSHTTKAGGVQTTGRAILWCDTCQLQLSHLSKDQQRRNVHCTIWEKTGVDGEGHPTWIVLAQGSSKLNLKAGDCYNREKGRVAALTAALASSSNQEFRAAAWTAFHGRHHGTQAKGA